MDKKRLITIIIFICIFVILIVVSKIYYNNKLTVSFETGTEEIFITRYVKKNNKVKEPSTPVKEGFIFKEWQLNGESYNFDSIVKDNIVLTAKWVKEEYITVKFNTNSREEIEDKTIIKGESIVDLPHPIKEGYEFVGWSIEGKLYNNEEIYDNVTLSAEYKNDIINTTYKVGDIVTVIGNYSNSAYSNSSNYKLAIGWERKILNIIENSNYPYVVGNETGVTGFFKASSIERSE